MTDIDKDVYSQIVKTADGRPWVQKCFRCNKSVNYIKDPSVFWVRVGEFVRHKKCKPEPIR